MAVDVDIETSIGAAAVSDRLIDTIDYARVAERIAKVGASERCHLLEALADKLVETIFAEFPVDRLQLWVRKLRAPLSVVAGSVGVRLDRTRMAHEARKLDPPPSPFLVQQISRMPKGRVLDLAAGRGRNTLYLLSHGMEVEAIDRDVDALSALTNAAQSRHLNGLTTHAVDLEADPHELPSLGVERYDAVIVCFYLYRPLFPKIMEALKPNGVLLYETFTIDNYFRRQHPRRWEFCLAHNELLRRRSSCCIMTRANTRAVMGAGRFIPRACWHRKRGHLFHHESHRPSSSHHPIRWELFAPRSASIGEAGRRHRVIHYRSRHH
jgi:dihydroneopterin aldolase